MRACAAETRVPRMNSKEFPLAPPKVRQPLFGDPWEGWNPAWGRGATPHELQERHSPSIPVTLRAPQGRAAERSQRRITDARLWEAMTPGQQDAALDIARVFESLSRGIGFAVSDWMKPPAMRGGGANPAEIHARLLNGYAAWTLRCRKAGVSHSMIIDVLVFGFSCQALDADRQVRKGRTKANLLKGLSLYCDVRGWPS
jgi:hypothetical protein